MEKMAHDLSLKISAQLHYDDDKREVIEYGLTAVFQMIVLFLVISAIGILGHFWYESLILFFCCGHIEKIDRRGPPKFNDRLYDHKCLFDFFSCHGIQIMYCNFRSVFI